MNPRNITDFDYQTIEPLPFQEKSRILSILHSPEKYRALQAEQLLSQMGFREPDDSNPYAWNSLLDIARHCLARASVPFKSTDSKREIISRALATSDYPILLANVAEKILTQGWSAAPVTYPEFTGTVEVRNFKTQSLIDISSFSKMTKVDEGGEVQSGEVAETAESFSLETFGKIFNIDKRALINDDTDTLKNAPLLMGNAARQTVEEAVYTKLLENPTLSDGTALFHSDHGNLTTGALNVDNLDTARAALASQTSNGILLNLPTTHLLVPKALEGKARTLASAQYPDGSLKVVSSAHLDLVSSTAWYLISSVNPPLIVATLKTKPTPTVTTKVGFETVAFKVIFDFAVVPATHMSIIKSTGL